MALPQPRRYHSSQNDLSPLMARRSHLEFTSVPLATPEHQRRRMTAIPDKVTSMSPKIAMAIDAGATEIASSGAHTADIFPLHSFLGRQPDASLETATQSRMSRFNGPVMIGRDIPCTFGSSSLKLEPCRGAGFCGFNVSAAPDQPAPR